MAKFSKAHYVALARVIKETEENTFWASRVSTTISELKGSLMDMLAADNPKFDKNRFLKACEPDKQEKRDSSMFHGAGGPNNVWSDEGPGFS